MELSTSLNVYSNTNASYEEILLRASKCGFKCFDFNPADYINKGKNFYTDENWRDNIKKIKLYADKLGVKFMQSHAYCYSMPEPQDVEYQMKKSIEASSIAGAPWVVMHPWITGLDDKNDIIKENIRRFETYIEYAKSMNIGIAIENVPKRIFWYGEEICGEAFSCAADLIEIVDELNNKFGNIGICWDTGHAHLTMESQYDEILKIGNRLKVLHIADNDGQYDDHMPPFFGYAKWGEIMKALKAIDYSGTFNFETHCFTRFLPDELIDDGVKMMHKIGTYVVNMYKNYK